MQCSAPAVLPMHAARRPKHETGLGFQTLVSLLNSTSTFRALITGTALVSTVSGSLARSPEILALPDDGCSSLRHSWTWPSSHTRGLSGEINISKAYGAGYLCTLLLVQQLPRCSTSPLASRLACPAAHICPRMLPIRPHPIHLLHTVQLS